VPHAKKSRQYPPPKKPPARTCRLNPTYVNDDFRAFIVQEDGLPEHNIVATTPVSYHTTVNSLHAAEWKAAMLEEYQSIIKNKTFDLVKLPAGQKVINMRWLYKLKRLASGAIDRFKARWIAKGYTQVFSVDFNETFVLVVCVEHLCLLIALAILLGYKIHQMDVTTAFLNTTLTKENYIHQLEGFINPERLDHVCHLCKSLYRLKQAPLKWNCTLDNHL
jgi:hypothetical protein